MNVIKGVKLSTVFTIACLLFAATIIFIFAKSYFSVSIFYVDSEKYHLVNEESNTMTYSSNSGPSIHVKSFDQDRIVIINNEQYSINIVNNANNIQYNMKYPNDHQYRVDDQSRLLITYNQNGEFVSDFYVYMGGKRVFQDDAEIYSPSSLVTAAYPMYHSKQGDLFTFCLSFALMIYGWCGYRYEKFQRFLFLISLRWIWTQDPEPSDFYFLTCKIGGILTIVSAIILTVVSLQLEIFR